VSARVAVGIGAGVVVVGGVAFLVWRGWRADEAGADVINDHSEEPARVAVAGDELTIGYVNGVPSNVTLRSIGDGKKLRTDAADKFNAMRAAASAAGVIFFVNSGFRSQAEQIYLHNGYVQKLPGFNMAARPGYSNHQGGISADIDTQGKGRESPTYKWLAVNARRFGFVNDVESEAWHWTYKPTAAALLT